MRYFVIGWSDDEYGHNLILRVNGVTVLNSNTLAFDGDKQLIFPETCEGLQIEETVESVDDIKTVDLTIYRAKSGAVS